MSIDTLGRQASEMLMDVTDDLNVDEAYHRTLHLNRPQRRRRMAMAIATAILVLIAGLSLGGQLRRSAVPAPPADGSAPVLVGQKLEAPITAVVPEGWEVLKNRGYVEMRPADGSPGVHIVMLVPRKVYEPPDYERAPLADDPIIWMTTHPDVQTSGQFGVDGPGFAWMGTKVDVSLSGKAQADFVHLMPLSKAASSPPLAITRDDAMFRWIVVYFENADPLAIAATSPSADDPRAVEAINELLASIQIQQQ